MCWKNGRIFFQNLFSVLTKCPVESPIVLQERHKITKTGAHRPVPQTKHAVEGLASGLKWQFTLWSPSGTPYFCSEKGMSAAMEAPFPYKRANTTCSVKPVHQMPVTW